MLILFPHVPGLPRKNNVKKPDRISSLVNSLLIRFIDYTPGSVKHEITVSEQPANFLSNQKALTL